MIWHGFDQAAEEIDRSRPVSPELCIVSLENEVVVLHLWVRGLERSTARRSCVLLVASLHPRLRKLSMKDAGIGIQGDGLLQQVGGVLQLVASLRLQSLDQQAKSFTVLWQSLVAGLDALSNSCSEAKTLTEASTRPQHQPGQVLFLAFDDELRKSSAGVRVHHSNVEAQTFARAREKRATQ